MASKESQSGEAGNMIGGEIKNALSAGNSDRNRYLISLYLFAFDYGAFHAS
jgi:hypothetical protein